MPTGDVRDIADRSHQFVCGELIERHAPTVDAFKRADFRGCKTLGVAVNIQAETTKPSRARAPTLVGRKCALGQVGRARCAKIEKPVVADRIDGADGKAIGVKIATRMLGV